MESEIFNVGDIVALKSHPYTDKVKNIIISGEQNLTPPLMIVSEIQELKTNKKSEKEVTKIFQFVCTCVWFSSRLQKFEKAKIKNVHLKKIVNHENSSVDFEEGQLVVLTTLGMELGKRKSSITFEDISLDKNSGRLTTNSYLAFVSPIMHVISSKVIRNVNGSDEAKVVVKCLWYNHASERFSEVILPKESLIVIDAIKDEMLIELDTVIKTSRFLLWATENKRQILCKPDSLSFRNGYYHINAYDFLLNQAIDIGISSKSNYQIIDNPFRSTAPLFDLAKNKSAFSSENVGKELSQAILDAAQNKTYIRIRYKNRNDKITLRTLKDYKLLEIDEDGTNVFYIEAYCLLKQDKRIFRIDRIQDFQELILTFQ